MTHAYLHDVKNLSINGYIPGIGYISSVHIKPKLTFKRVDFRLKEWGMWLARSTDHGLGYPSQSTLVTALQGSRSTAPYYPKDNEAAEEVNLIVIQLGKEHAGWDDVLKNEYRDSGTQTKKSKKLGMTRDRYIYILNKARKYVEKELK